MFEGLDRIDWAAIGSNHIPAIVRALASENNNIRDAAYGKLFDEYVPWDVFEGVYSYLLPKLVSNPSIVLTIPFIVELLTDATSWGKEQALNLLHELARYIDLESYVTEPKREEFREHAAKLHKLVANQRQVFESLIEHDDWRVVRAAKEVLQLLDDRD